MTAAINAIAPANNDSVLITPPRTLGDKERATPINPKMMAITASTKPKKAPVVKLKTAATIAMMEGILNLA